MSVISKVKFSYLALVLSLTLSVSAIAGVEPLVEKRDKTVVTDQKIKENLEIKQKYFFDFSGKEFVGFPNVFSPKIFPSTKGTSDIPVNAGETVLEIGPGTGVFTVLSALKGAKKVVAVDINPDAVSNTLENARIHGVSDRVSARVGDIFSSLSKDEKFDLIFWQIPFCHRETKNLTEKDKLIELSVFDPDHEFLRRYLEGAADYLNNSGRVLLTYSSTHGDINRMYYWAEKYGWEKPKLLKKSGNEFISIELYEFRRKSPSSRDTQPHSSSESSKNEL